MSVSGSMNASLERHIPIHSSWLPTVVWFCQRADNFWPRYNPTHDSKQLFPPFSSCWSRPAGPEWCLQTTVNFELFHLIISCHPPPPNFTAHHLLHPQPHPHSSSLVIPSSPTLTPQHLSPPQPHPHYSSLVTPPTPPSLLISCLPHPHSSSLVTPTLTPHHLLYPSTPPHSSSLVIPPQLGAETVDFLSFFLIVCWQFSLWYSYFDNFF